MPVDLNRRRFTVDEYHRMGEAGILPEHEPGELIAGEIVVREPIGSRHPRPGEPLHPLLAARPGGRARGPNPKPNEPPEEEPQAPPHRPPPRPPAGLFTA